MLNAMNTRKKTLENVPADEGIWLWLLVSGAFGFVQIAHVEPLKNWARSKQLSQATGATGAFFRRQWGTVGGRSTWLHGFHVYARRLRPHPRFPNTWPASVFDYGRRHVGWYHGRCHVR